MPIIFALIILASAGYLMIRSQTPPSPQPPTPSPTIVPPKPQILNRVNIQGVSVNNFLETSRTIEETGEVFIAEKPEYAIVYHKSNGSFLISILSAPFETIRQNAEEDFLQILGIDKTSACKLDVVVGTPYFANPDNSGIIYPLSFCP